MINQNINYKIRMVLIEAFEKCQSINYSKSEKEYFDLATETMEKFKGITIAAMQEKFSKNAPNN